MHEDYINYCNSMIDADKVIKKYRKVGNRFLNEIDKEIKEAKRMKNRFRLITKKSAGIDFAVLAVYDIEEDKSYIWDNVDDIKKLFEKINNLAESSSELFADFLKNPEAFKYTDNEGLVEKKQVEINEKDGSVTFTIPEEVIKSTRHKDPLKPPFEIT